MLRAGQRFSHVYISACFARAPEVRSGARKVDISSIVDIVWVSSFGVSKKVVMKVTMLC